MGRQVKVRAKGWNGFRGVWWSAALLLCFAAPALADTITYQYDFENPLSPWVFNGTAQRITGDSSDPRIISGSASGQLTDLSVSNVLSVGAAGSIILGHPISTSFFDVSFSFQLFGGEASNPFGFAGDGITFSVFGGVSPASVGLCCSGLGFANIVSHAVPAFSVEFDTYANAAIDTCYDTGGNQAACPFDGPAPHISVTLGSRGIFGSDRDQELHEVPGLRNQVHNAHIAFSDSILNVSLDGQAVITDFLVPAEFIPPSAFIGFTGSTGSYADYQIIDNISVTVVPEPPTLSLLLLGLMIGLAAQTLRAASHSTNRASCGQDDSTG